MMFCMRIHHLNCGSLRVVTPDDATVGLDPRPAVAHCLLVESDSAGLILIDSGIGSRDIDRPVESLGSQFIEQSHPKLDVTETAAAQVRDLGFDPADVEHIVLTHLDLDHAGGIADFPHAQVHVSLAELRAASAPGFHAADANRYRPLQWVHQPRWAPFGSERGESWFGFEAVVQPAQLPDEIRLIPLGGHSAGHTGVAVRKDATGTHDAAWVLHAGDAYFYHAELDAENPRSTPGLTYLQNSTEIDRELRLGTNARLRELARRFGNQVEIFCAHDPWEFAHVDAK